MRLIYVMDAQCGWCYGNGANIMSIYDEFKEQFEFEFLNGGMWIGENAPASGERIANYIIPQIPRLMSHTGMKISEDYQTLISQSDYVLSSLEPSAASVLLKKLMPQLGFKIDKEIQEVLFVQGERLDRIESYLPILEKYQVDSERFEQLWMSEENLKDTFQEFEKGRALASGFPSLILEDNGKLQRLAAGYFDLEAMREVLQQLLKANSTSGELGNESCEIGGDC